MANSRFDVIVGFVDNFSKGASSVKNGLSEISNFAERNQKTFQNMAIGGTAVFGALTAGVGKAVSMFQEAQVAEARLEQIATQVTGATEEQIQGFKNLASELQGIGVLGDDVIFAGQSQVASFTKSAEVVAELSDDLADLAVAQYGVNVSQEQAIQTGNLLGKALNGNLGALTKSGILVGDDFKKAFESANTEQERAVILSQIIQDNYGGLNATMRETSAGGLVALQNSFGDLIEAIGGAFVPMIDTVTTALVPFVDKIVSWAVENPKLISGIILVVGGLAGLVAVVGTLGLAIPAIVTGFGALATAVGFLFSPITLIIGAIGLLAYAIYTNWESIKNFTMTALTGISEGIASFWETTTAIFTGAFEAIKFLFTGYIEIYKTIFTLLFQGIMFIVNGGKDLLISAFTALGTGIGGTFSAVVSSVSSMVKGLINGIISMINKAINALNKMGEVASKVPGVRIPRIPNIPMLAEGGIITKPTLAMIGEGGESEAVIPLSKLGQMTAGGGNTVIINGSVLGDRRAMESMLNDILANKTARNINYAL